MQSVQATLPSVVGNTEVFATDRQALAALRERHGPGEECWHYEDAHERSVAIQVQWNRPEGPLIRSISRRGAAWVLAPLPKPWPLYRLPDLLAPQGRRIYVTQTETAVDEASQIDRLCTTNLNGLDGVDQTDWRPLAGQDVAILPNHDEQGRLYAQAVASFLLALEPPARVRIVTLPNLPPHGDLRNWTAEHPLDRGDEIGEDLERLVEALPPLPAMPRGEGPVFQCFADVTPTTIRWLWPGRVPLGRITLLVGRPGEGKSFLTTDLAARVSTGRPWPDGSPGQSGSVLFICAEDDPSDTLRPRLDAHGADVSRIHLLAAVRRRGSAGRFVDDAFTLADARILEVGLQTYPDCRLIVVDPIGSFLGSGTDSYRDSDVRAVLDPVARLAELYGPAVLVVAHRRKNAGGNHADDLALGSRAFTGVARAVWHLTRDPRDKNRRLLLSGKNNLAAAGQGLAFRIEGEPASLHWEEGPVDMTANDALAAETAATEEPGRPPNARSQAGQWLRELLADGPLPAREVRRQGREAGFSWRTINRAKNTVGIHPTRTSSTGPWVWALAAEPAAPVAQP